MNKNKEWGYNKEDGSFLPEGDYIIGIDEAGGGNTDVTSLGFFCGGNESGVLSPKPNKNLQPQSTQPNPNTQPNPILTNCPPTTQPNPNNTQPNKNLQPQSTQPNKLSPQPNPSGVLSTYPYSTYHQNNNPVYITCKFNFESAHRLLGHTGKCRYVHGHSFKTEIVICSDKLNDLGMVMDYSNLKTLIGSWILREWDHNLLLHPSDPLVKLLENSDVSHHFFSDKKPFIMPNHLNPTSENLAIILSQICTKLLGDFPSVSLTSLRIWETESCSAFLDLT